MPRLARNRIPDGTYHVTARGVAGAPVFVDDDDRATFVRLLARTLERFEWRCLAWCLMTTHYHLVVETCRDRLSSGMHALNGRYAQLFNERHHRRGHLFENRFSAFIIDSEEHLLTTCRYVLENPARAGLCREPAEWRWSGCAFV